MAYIPVGIYALFFINLEEVFMDALDCSRLLKEALHAFNDIPNKKIVGSDIVKDTYQLAALIDKFLREEERQHSS